MKNEQTVRESIENVVGATRAAQELQEMRLEKIRQETQVDIDKFAARANELTHAGMVRYHAFKSGLLEDCKTRNHNVGKELYGSFYNSNPEEFTISSIIEFYGGTLVFENDSRDGRTTIGVPLNYFNDPEAWEKTYLARLDEIVEMNKKANIIWPEAGYKASTTGLDQLGPFFRLRSSVNINTYPTYLVKYDTGNVYNEKLYSKEAILEGNAVYIAWLR